MKKYNYLFIGGGNMAQAIMHGMNKGLAHIDYTNYIIEKNINLHHQIKYINTQKHIVFEHITDYPSIMNEIDCIILAIKPQDAQSVMQELQNTLKGITQKNLCIMSIMAGISLQTIQHYLPYACIRAMPNTPLLVGMGATALVANHITQAAHKEMIASIFNACGISLWLEDEANLHTVTALSGGGPAYVFYILQAMQNYATQNNLPAEIARQLISQTFKGAAHMALNSIDNFSVMQNTVTSKGGTTEQAISYLNTKHIDKHIENALKQAHIRSQEMEKEIT
jgi:pyrroline-5-carboxylate reductase